MHCSYSGIMTSTTWLSEAEQRAWRNWLAATAHLPAALNRELQRDADLSLQDFEVLVHLSESTERRARISDLAQALEWERSRLSHHVKRMEKRGLVAREECTDDARGAFVVLAERGRTAIEAAAPGHAATVKRLVFEDLSPAEVETLTAVTGKILARLQQD